MKGWKAIGNRLDDKLRMSGFKFSEISENNEKENSHENSGEETENLTLF